VPHPWPRARRFFARAPASCRGVLRCAPSMAPAGCFLRGPRHPAGESCDVPHPWPRRAVFCAGLGILPGSPAVCHIHGPGGLSFARAPASCRGVLRCATSMAPAGFFLRGPRHPAGESCGVPHPWPRRAIFCERCLQPYVLVTELVDGGLRATLRDRCDLRHPLAHGRVAHADGFSGRCDRVFLLRDETHGVTLEVIGVRLGTRTSRGISSGHLSVLRGALCCLPRSPEEVGRFRPRIKQHLFCKSRFSEAGHLASMVR